MQQKLLLVQSCYDTLIRLGDLSRYRETELKARERNWGPAKGYYELANALMPSSGTSHNQLAVMALADSDHLRAVYYLYRAVSIEKPFPTAQANLDLEFKKILQRHAKHEPISAGQGSDSVVALQDLFLVLHASYYRGKQLSSISNVEEDILLQLADSLRESHRTAFESVLRRMSLINIAAESVAGAMSSGRAHQVFPVRAH